MTAANKVLTSFATFRQECCQQVDKILKETCQNLPCSQLTEALSYSLFNGGKRVRPILVYGAYKTLNDGSSDRANTAAAAIECIHAYSLIHDDLPAMDDDDLRRGKPTCHIAFNEATAILAGDALQALAFELVSDDPTLESSIKVKMIQCLAHSAGAKGMVAGQAIDLQSVNQKLNITALEQMHRLKTGALIDAAMDLGALAAGNTSPQQLQALHQYGQALGLAFQVQDDILDVISDTNTLGKPQGADQALNKPTYVSLLGLEKAQAKSQELYQTAVSALDIFGQSADHLRHLAAYVINRKH